MMGSLLKLAAMMLTELGQFRRLRAAALRLEAAGLCVGAAGLLALAVVGCAATALWIYALPLLGPVGAPLVVAGCLLALSIVLAAAAWLMLRPGQRRSGVEAGPQMLMAEATRLFNEHKGAVLMAAVIAGMAAGNGNRRK